MTSTGPPNLGNAVTTRFLAIELSRHLDSVRVLQRDLDLLIARLPDRNSAYDRDRVLVLDRVHSFVRAVNVMLTFTSNVGRDKKLDRVRTRIRILTHSLDLERVAVGIIRYHVHDLERDLDHAHRNAVRLDHVAAQISPAAGRATGIATRILPSADRPRYAEEYEAELYELAKVSHRAQWAYAARLIACAPRLRHELRHATREAVQGW